MTREYLKKKGIEQSANSPDINLIENLWYIVDNKLLKLNIQNTDDLKTVWRDISNDINEKLFG